MFNRARRRASVLVVLSLFVSLAAQAATTLYVAPDGNDAWSGAHADPLPAGDDGPLASLAGARDRLRVLRAAGELDEAVEVLLRGGDYAVTEAIVFAPEDSGTAEAPVTFAAYPGEHPVLHGGRRITGWQAEGGRWVAEIPEVARGEWRFSALWADGRRRQPARTPNATNEAGDFPEDRDFFYADGPVKEANAEGKEENSRTKFRYREGDFEAWESLDDAWLVVFHSWATSLLRVKDLDEERRIVEFTGPARWPFCRWREDQWYYVEHLFEALDQPGEWFLDSKAGKIHYLPMPGETIEETEIIAPVARQLIVVARRPEQGASVEHLRFRGLTLHYSEFPIAPKGHSDAQAAYAVPAAFELTGARHCVIDRCEIAHTGTYALWFRRGCQDNAVTHSEAFDLGAGGVRIGEGGDPASEEEAALRNRVENCYLHDGGRIFRSAVGVWIGRSSFNEITHNDIGDFRYSGVSVGWSWGYAPSSAHHNLIAFNHIHDIGKKQLNDMGGIYALGDSPGTVLRNNYIHDVLSNPKLYGGWGLYTDEGSTGILMENNIVHHTRTGTFHQHYGKENIVRNNILAYSQTDQIIRTREEEHLSFTLENNIIYFNNGRLLGSSWKNGNYAFDRNCYWDTSGSPLDFAGKSFEEWQAEGRDMNSIVADPLFEDIDGRDFRLKPDSPALALGFKPIDVSKIGLYGEAEWVAKPGKVARTPFTPPKAP